MEEDRHIELELSEETTRLLEEYAKKTGRTEEEVCEYILSEFLERQIPIIEKKATETGRPVSELLNMQFNKILQFMNTKDNN